MTNQKERRRADDQIDLTIQIIRKLAQMPPKARAEALMDLRRFSEAEGYARQKLAMRGAG